MFDADSLVAGELYPPLPQPDDLTRFFWEGVAEGRLTILRCDSCGFYIHWPAPVCPSCMGTAMTPTNVSGDATLVTWTFPNQPTTKFYSEHRPYALAVVELAEQERLKMVTNLVDYEKDELRIRMPLRVTFREVAPGVTLPLFAPAGKA